MNKPPLGTDQQRMGRGGDDVFCIIGRLLFGGQLQQMFGLRMWLMLILSVVPVRVVIMVDGRRPASLVAAGVVRLSEEMNPAVVDLEHEQQRCQQA